MHVDGGATNQIFLFPPSLNWKLVAEKLHVTGTSQVYLIRNARINPVWKSIKPKLLPIALRSSDALIRTQGLGDMYRLYDRALRDGQEYHLVHIPDEWDQHPNEAFDKEYMIKLFNLGYGQAKKQKPWKTKPPGFCNHCRKG